jgi:hypothetical protein
MTGRKAVMFVLLFTFLASLIGDGYLDFRYSRLNPAAPQPEAGRVRRRLAYKTYVYVSEREDTAARALFVTSFASFLALFILGVRWKFMAVAGSTAEPPVIIKREHE